MTKKVESVLGPKKHSRNSAIDWVIELVQNYTDASGKVLEEGAAMDQETVDELAKLDKALLDDIRALRVEPDIKTIVELIGELDPYDDEQKMIMEAIPDFDAEKYFTARGCVVIKVEGAEDRAKLDEFIRHNIHPYNINPETTVLF